MAKKVFTDESLATLVSEIKTYTDSAVSTKANSSHNHAASNITSGTLSSDRLPIVPIAKGGTGATDASVARTNLGVYSTTQVDNQITTFSNTLKTYTDNSVSNHNHDSKYDTKGAADASLSSGKAYTDEKVGELDSGFSEVILTMIGNDITEDGIPTIRSIAADESGKVQTNLDTHTSDTSLHFTPAEKTKLSGVESGAQKNTITGVKGNSESSYRTGNVNITKANIGLGNVDNTSDANKPVSTAQKTAIDNSLASAKSYTDTKVANLLNNSTEAVDSIMELASAMEANDDVVQALSSAIGNKVDKVSGKGLSTNDLTATLKSNYDTAYSHVSNKSNPHGVTLNQLGVNATATELNYVDGVTSSIQTQLDSKQASITGGATTITSSNLTASRALVSDSSGKVAVSAVTSTELGYLDGVTSAIQTQINAKVPTSRTVNGKALSSNITLSASDVGAYTKTEIDAMEFITIADIDAICGGTIVAASEVTF